MGSKIDEIRQRCEVGRPIPRIDVKWLLSEVDRLNALHKREIIVTGEYAKRVIELTARAEAAEAERDKAVKDIPHTCETCRHRIAEQRGAVFIDRCGLPVDGWRKCGRNYERWEWRGPQTRKGDSNNG